jgi:glycosyltransferase involved in cell wall biosynthesis
MNNRPKVTLCMIVKDETHIIEQCLRSIAKYVDRYDITDTGSTDGTQDLIKKTMEELGVSGEVHQSDWKGFGDHGNTMGSRTESLNNAKNSDAEYAWVIDADDYVEGKFEYPETMDADCYSLCIGRGDFTWWRNQIFKLSVDWKYMGILHEYATTDSKPREELNAGKISGEYKVIARTEGNRNVGISPIDKYKRDAELLEKAIVDEPQNDRYQFYLAQSYFDSQQFEKSLAAYEKRVEMGGWHEEIYYSKLRCGILKGLMERPLAEVAGCFVDAFNYRPIRAEPLWFLSRMYRMNNMPAAAYLYAKMGLDIPYPENDILFIQDDVYRWGILDEVGATAFYANQPQIGYQASKILLEKNLVPALHRQRVIENFRSYEGVMRKIQEHQANQQIPSVEKQKKQPNSNKKSTKVKEKTGYKKRPKQKA